MNECIIHYDSLSRHSNPVFVTKRPLKTMLLAKQKHKKRNDRHIFQFKLVPKENTQRYRYHRNPCYSRFTERIRQKWGITLDDGITDSILNVVDVGKSRMKDFRQKGLISKEISFHAKIKKSNYKSFCHAMRKMRITKKDGCAKIEEVNRDILGISNSYSLKTGKPAHFKRHCLMVFFQYI